MSSFNYTVLITRGREEEGGKQKGGETVGEIVVVTVMHVKKKRGRAIIPKSYSR